MGITFLPLAQGADWTDLHDGNTCDNDCINYLPSVPKEIDELDTLIDGQTTHYTYETHGWTKDELNQDNLDQCTVFHWSGHGGNEDSVSRPYIIVKGNAEECSVCYEEYQYYYGDDVPSDLDHIELVFLNACKSSQDSDWHISLHYGFVGVSQGDVETFLGWDDSVGDDNAKQFATEFLDTLTYGYTVEHARNLAEDKVDPQPNPEIYGDELNAVYTG